MDPRFTKEFFKNAILYARAIETKEEKQARLRRLAHWRNFWKELTVIHFKGWFAWSWSLLKSLALACIVVWTLFVCLVIGTTLFIPFVYIWPVVFDWSKYGLTEVCNLYTNVTVCPFGLEEYLKNVSICLKYRRILQTSKEVMVICKEILK